MNGSIDGTDGFQIVPNQRDEHENTLPEYTVLQTSRNGRQDSQNSLEGLYSFDFSHNCSGYGNGSRRGMDGENEPSTPTPLK